MIPRGAQPIVESLRRREAWTDAVVISFTGRRAPNGYASLQHIYPAQGVRHDWRWLNGLPTWIMVQAGSPADPDAIKEIADRAKPYAMIIDMATRGVGFLIPAIYPNYGGPPRLAHHEPGSEYHAAWGLE